MWQLKLTQSMRICRRLFRIVRLICWEIRLRARFFHRHELLFEHSQDISCVPVFYNVFQHILLCFLSEYQVQRKPLPLHTTTGWDARISFWYEGKLEFRKELLLKKGSDGSTQLVFPSTGIPVLQAFSWTICMRVFEHRSGVQACFFYPYCFHLKV